MTDAILGLLVCPGCDSAFDPSSRSQEALVCRVCSRRVPVMNGIPRFVETPDTDEARRTQASFGYEWTHFNDWRPSGSTNFNDYFAGVDLRSLRDALVLDAGCGMGRHAVQIAPHVRALVAVDFSLAIDQAARNTSPHGNVDCVQADLTALPLRDAAFDYAYSLGVLHHIRDTEGTLRRLVAKVKPGGRVRIYLYWKRAGLSGALLSLVSAVRRVTTRLPLPLLRMLCWLLSVVLYAGVIAPYKLLTALGVHVHAGWPLFVYSKYPFNVLYNDQFDRFSAPIEKRYSADEVRAMLGRAGLTDISVQPCFGWVGEGVRAT